MLLEMSFVINIFAMVCCSLFVSIIMSHTLIHAFLNRRHQRMENTTLRPPLAPASGGVLAVPARRSSTTPSSPSLCLNVVFVDIGHIAAPVTVRDALPNRKVNAWGEVMLFNSGVVAHTDTA